MSIIVLFEVFCKTRKYRLFFKFFPVYLALKEGGKKIKGKNQIALIE